MASVLKGSTCDGILEMIDFFSQVMHPELIESYGYSYIHDILEFEASAIYMVRPPGTLCLAQYKHLEGLPIAIDLTERHAMLATKVGVVLYEGLEPYFAGYKGFESVDLLMPLVVADQLIGFIVARRSGEWCQEDFTFAEAAKKMVNLAFGTGLQMTENKRFQSLMDRRIYDQMLLAHLSKLLLQHLDERELIHAAVEGIRELTASAQTAFFLKDEYSHKLELVHYTDLIQFNRLVGHIHMDAPKGPLKQTYHVEDEADVLSAYLGEAGMHMLSRVGAKWVVFLTSEETLGFVTLGNRVSGEPLSEGVLPLVESIMGSVLIGLKNAMQFKLLARQKNELSQSLSAMESMAKTLNNLSSAGDLQELGELLLMNFVFQLGVSSGIVYFETAEGAYKAAATYGLTQLEAFGLENLELTQRCVKELSTGWLTCYEAEAVSSYLSFDQEVLLTVENFVAAGIWPKSIETNHSPQGFFIGFNMEKPFGQFEKYYIETLTHGVAPLMTLLK